MSHLIKLENVTIGYEKEGLLDSINLSIERDQFWGIMGPNGGGKSTLIKTLLGLIPPISGYIRSENVTIFGYVPQHEKFDPIFPISVWESVSMGRYSRVPAGRRLSRADNEIVRRSMDNVGISQLKDRTFRSLSDGEKQRALLARAIAGEPEILVLDEPTASVDIKGEAQIMELVKNIQAESKLAVLMVSHFLNTVSEFSDHIILIDKDSDFFQAGDKTQMMKKDILDNFFGLNINLN